MLLVEERLAAGHALVISSHMLDAARMNMHTAGLTPCETPHSRFPTHVEIQMEQMNRANI